MRRGGNRFTDGAPSAPGRKTIDQKSREAVEDYFFVRNGVIHVLPEAATSIDWAEGTAMRALARKVSRIGHAARKRRKWRVTT